MTQRPTLARLAAFLEDLSVVSAARYHLYMVQSRLQQPQPTGRGSVRDTCREMIPRLCLRPHEVAGVLQLSLWELRRAVERGDLTLIGITSRWEFDPEDVLRWARRRSESGELGPLAPYLAQQLAAGRLVVPRPGSVSARPPSLLRLLDGLRAMQPSVLDL